MHVRLSHRVSDGGLDPDAIATISGQIPAEEDWHEGDIVFGDSFSSKCLSKRRGAQWAFLRRFACETQCSDLPHVVFADFYSKSHFAHLQPLHIFACGFDCFVF